jgi:hypothetical protein
MADKDREENQQVGHNSTTIPGGEKDIPSGDPGRTPGKAEGEDDSSATGSKQGQ